MITGTLAADIRLSRAMRVLTRAGLVASAAIVAAPAVLAAGEQHAAVSASAPAPAAAAAPEAAATSVATVPIVLAVVGVACIVLSVSVGFYFYVRIRNPQLGTRLKPLSSIFTRNSAKSKGSKMVIGEPELRFAPEHAANAIDLSTATAAEKRALSRGGKIATLQRDAARATADLWNMPFSSSNETNSSGPAPRTSTESDREAGRHNLRRPPSVARPEDQDESQRLASLRVHGETDHMSRNEKRARRVAVPSTLLRSLGDLPTIPGLVSSTSGSSASDSSLESIGSIPRLAPISSHGDKRNTKDNGSLTPVLNLSFELDPRSTGTSMPFEDELDFEIQRSAWLTSTLSTAFDRIKVSPSNSAAAVTFEKPAAKGLLSTSSLGAAGRKGSITDSRPSVDSKRSGAGSFTSRADAESVYQSANSLATARTSNSINTKHTSVDSYAPPIPSIPSHMHVAINMPEMLNHRASQIQRKSLGKPIEVPVKAIREVPSNAPQGGFRPLSLGLSLSSSSSSSIGAVLFKAAKQSFWSEALQTDIESQDSSHGLKESSSLEKSNSSRKSSSSLSRSQASSSSSLPPSLPSKPMQLVSPNNTTFSFNSGNSSTKTTSTLPSLMISDDSSMSRSVDTTATSFTAPNASAGASEASGASATAMKPSPTIKEYNLDAKHSMARELAGNFVRSNSPKLNVSAAGGKFAFVTPYHRAVFPEAPQEEEEDREAEGQAGKRREDLLAQLAVGTKAPSPKISFTEGLRARLTRNSPIMPPASPSLSTKQPSPILEAPSRPRADQRPDTMSTTASTSFGGPTEQWRISTEDTEDDIPPFLRGQGERTGLGLTSRGQDVTARSSLVAVASNKAERAESVARYNARQESPARTSMSISPIMQSSKWGLDREKTRSSHLSGVAEDRENEEAEIDFRDLQTSITLGSSDSSPLDGFQRTLSRPPTRSSPISSPVIASSPKLATSKIRNSQQQQQQFRSPSSAQVSRMSTFSFASPRSNADTMSIASSCMSDTMGEGMEDAVDRRAKLLQSVQQSLAARTRREKVSSRLSYGESASGFSASRSNLMSKAAVVGSTQPLKKPANLVLKPSNVLPPHIISPLTPPETPADPKSPSASSMMTLKMHATSSTVRSPLREGFVMSSHSSGSLASSASTASDMTSKGGLTAIPRLRPLSLTAQASIFDEPSLQLIAPSSAAGGTAGGAARSPISSPAPSHHAKDARTRQQQMYQERRLSRGLQVGAGGVLPPIASHAFSSSSVTASPRIGLAA